MTYGIGFFNIFQVWLRNSYFVKILKRK